MDGTLVETEFRPFAALAADTAPQSPLRARITEAYRRPEPDCLAPLLDAAVMGPEDAARTASLATRLVTALRAKKRGGGVEALVHEYSLASEEGVALMCLAEALLRIPDNATRDALIRDKIGGGDWRAHLGHSPSLFVNAATWGLLVTGRLAATSSETSLSSALTRLIARGGEPLIRRGVDLAMRLMGEQFVTGETIAEALGRARKLEARGFRYSYDMLGEAAVTAEDAGRYRAAYEGAIDAIGAAAAGRGPIAGPGISIKLSALHPRYARAQRARVMGELLPVLRALAARARAFDIGLNIDAEESERLDLSLDLLEALAGDAALAGWEGLGFVVQAYQKRAPYVIDWVEDLARRTGRRLMVRLVKGAYWDSEIKRAQVDGLDGFPVYTRKVHTDVAYLACARRLLAARDAVFPQFATHNAQTLSAVMTMAGPDWDPAQFEFQCLHGMGEPLYDEVVGPAKLDRPCRVYAPVGTHETLLAYLVRRLLENGANTSFVNRIGDADVPVAELVADPVSVARAGGGAPHPRIAPPRALFGAAHWAGRANSAGMDLSNEAVLADLAATLAGPGMSWRSVPMLADGDRDGAVEAVRNPADRRDVVGEAVFADAALCAAAFGHAAASGWGKVAPAARADALAAAADALEARMPALLGLIVREAGKSLPNAVGEVREAVDFLRYYAAQARGLDPAAHRPLGPVVCISPWNFPLAIFTGQVAAALAAGNPVLAKPAEETPLIAAEAVRLLHAAGVPRDALQLLPGAGEVGAALVADPRGCGVTFTGSTEVARLIARQLAGRLGPDGGTIPLIAETGGQNAMIVDSSALAEQVVGDVIASAFDSAGQRCSALRVLCVQDDVADRVLAMLKGALAEIAVGNPDRLATDCGPVISEAAQAGILAHVDTMRARGCPVWQVALPDACRHGTFVPPTLIEIGALAELEREVFGPVLHVVRFRRQGLDGLVSAINATGYALTFGLHTRIDETIGRVVPRVAAGNVYVNRNVIGAVVGVQPFGGHGLSGTGPKAGGPLYLHRLMAATPGAARPCGAMPEPLAALRDWLAAAGRADLASACTAMGARAGGAAVELTGPVGERNVYALWPRGRVRCLAATPDALLLEIAAALATGNVAVVAALPTGLPAAVAERVAVGEGPCDAVLFEGDDAALLALAGALTGGALTGGALTGALAGRAGPLVAVHRVSVESLRDSAPLDWLLHERTVSTNTAAAGGNASLMTIG
jgi:RHH-type proline utilization regulon transcriptional repressor/proline dehydrogenase/delta 1-pyrroline-5-carboxylate dehydrogenase